IGRYYAMDRDKRWERVEKAYRLLVFGEGRPRQHAVEAIREYYNEGITDEFMLPIVLVDKDAKPVATVKDKDSIIFFNFRADRARQITRAFTEKDFNGFDVGQRPQVFYTCMTNYSYDFPLPVAFQPEHHQEIFADALAENGLRNL